MALTLPDAFKNRNLVQNWLFQLYYDYEIILVDDGSADSTADIAFKYKDKVRVYTIENGGIERASNFGIGKAYGEFILRVDADDKLTSHCLQRMSEHLSKDFISFFYSNYWVINSESKLISEMYLPEFEEREVLRRGDFLATGTFYRKTDLLEVGCYSEEYKNCGLENYELIINMIGSDKKGLLVPEPLFYYRKHDNNFSIERRQAIDEYGQALFKRNRLGHYGYNVFHPYRGSE